MRWGAMDNLLFYYVLVNNIANTWTGRQGGQSIRTFSDCNYSNRSGLVTVVD